MKIVRDTIFTLLLTSILTINVNADVLEVPVNGSISGFGPNLYRGQTFIAPQDIAENLTVFVGESNSIPGPVTYHVLITEIDTSTGLRPTTVLFESGPLVTNIGNRVIPPAVTIDLGQLPLTVGVKYAWILDAYVEIENNPGPPYPSALVGLNDISADNFPEIESLDLSLGLFPTGTREDHFSRNWFVSNQDLAFTMNFSAAVEVVNIDILPKKDENVINLNSEGSIQVAILSTQEFFAFNEVDPESVKFGPSLATATRNKVKDVNSDGLSDMIFYFKVRDTGIACNDTEATLIGETYDGSAIEGTDSIVTKGCD